MHLASEPRNLGQS